MNLLDKATIRYFYQKTSRLNPPGSAEALGWAKHEGQERRFKALCDGLIMNNTSVLDIGCGYGDLKIYLDQHYQQVIYTGIDITNTFLEEAHKRLSHHPNVTLLQGDVFDSELPLSDYVLASGIFGVKIQDVSPYLALIQKMYASARKAACFNMLTTAENKNLVVFRKEEIATYCKGFAPHCQIVEGYLPNDFTVRLLKNIDDYEKKD